MAYTRRHFAKLLQAGAACALAGFRPDVLKAAGLRDPGAGARGAASVFEPLAGSEFRLTTSLGGSPRFLTLSAVESAIKPGQKALLAKHRTPDVEYTTLRFSLEGPALPEGSYRLEHPTAGAVDVYLNPGLPGKYRAHFSLLPEGYLAGISIPRAPLPAPVTQEVSS